jgi:hypothetical protein
MISTRKVAYNWWCALSMNEQDYYTALHPFYGYMGVLYTIQHYYGIPDLYVYLMARNLLN